MARYSHKGYDTIRYRTKYRDTIRSDQHCRRCRCLDAGRPARRRSAGGRFLWSPVLWVLAAKQ